jgi:hypothetical protein
MNMRQKLLVAATVMLLAAGSAFANNNNHGNPKPGILPVQSGQYSDLTVKQWQWTLEQPVSTNPAIDETGAMASNGQATKGNIFFLAGYITVSPTPILGGGEYKVERTITIPAGKRLFFPILDYWADNAGDPPTTFSLDQLRAFASDWINSISELHAIIDEVPVNDLRSYRVVSPVFNYTLPCDSENIAQFYGINICGRQPPSPGAIADGYYLLLTPLPPGRHEIKFGGTAGKAEDNNLFILDVTYHITVTP